MEFQLIFFNQCNVERGEPHEQAEPLIQQDVERGEPPEQAQPLIQQDHFCLK